MMHGKDGKDGGGTSSEHNIRITLTSRNLRAVEKVCADFKEAARNKDLKVSGPCRLPTRRLQITTRKSPCGEGTNTWDKFEMRIHKRLMDLRARTEAVREIIGIQIEPGVDVEVTVSKPGVAMERTFVCVKPDGVQRQLVGTVIQRFERRGYKLVAMKFTKASRELLEKHYAEHKGKPFFEGIVNFMSSSPVVAMVFEGRDVIAQARKLMGATRPGEADRGTIRGDFCQDTGRNLIHGSDSAESAAREIALWFTPSELVDWNLDTHKWSLE